MLRHEHGANAVSELDVRCGYGLTVNERGSLGGQILFGKKFQARHESQ